MRDRGKLWTVSAPPPSNEVQETKKSSTYRAALSYNSNRGIASSFMFLGTASTSEDRAKRSEMQQVITSVSGSGLHRRGDW